MASRMTWLGVWTRAVIEPATRRAAGLWVGALIVGAVLFGPTGLRPADITQLARFVPAVGAALAIAWLLVFVPIARGVVHADGARYLRSLPGPRWAPRVLAAAALVALQLPWLLVWVLGEGVRGAAVVAAWTAPIALVAAWRPRPRRLAAPRWRSGATALRGVFARALARRAGDALMRAAALSIVAGALAGLVVANNHLVEASAATLATSVIAVVLIAAQIGVRLVVCEAHRASAWLAASLGISDTARAFALAAALGMVDVATGALAVAGFALVSSADLATLGLVALGVVAVTLASAIAGASTIWRGGDSPQIAARLIVGAVVAAAICVIWLGLVGAVGAVGALVTICALAVRR